MLRHFCLSSNPSDIYLYPLEGQLKFSPQDLIFHVKLCSDDDRLKVETGQQKFKIN
jgi:hypothetical protein